MDEWLRRAGGVLSDAASKLILCGAASLDDARAWFHLPPLPDGLGALPWRPVNMTPDPDEVELLLAEDPLEPAVLDAVSGECFIGMEEMPPPPSPSPLEREQLMAQISAEIYAHLARGILPMCAEATAAIRLEAIDQRREFLVELEPLKELERAGRVLAAREERQARDEAEEQLATFREQLRAARGGHDRSGVVWRGLVIVGVGLEEVEGFQKSGTALEREPHPRGLAYLRRSPEPPHSFVEDIPRLMGGERGERERLSRIKVVLQELIELGEASYPTSAHDSLPSSCSPSPLTANPPVIRPFGWWGQW
jgi:hypothetical protein